MNVFISWSGDKSKDVANLLHDWLPLVLQSLRPWVSTRNIAPGTIWFNQIFDTVEDNKDGIIVVTKENKEKPWIMFESGALFKGNQGNRLNVLLVDISPEEIDEPLRSFNHVKCVKDGLYNLVKGFNDRMKNDIGRLSDENLKKCFEKWYPDFEVELKKIKDKYADSDENREKIEKCDQKIEKYPNDASSYYERGLLGKKKIVNYASAVRDYLYAIYLNPNLAKAYYSLIDLAMEHKDYELVDKFADEACTRFPDDGDAFGYRAYLKTAEEKYDEGISDSTYAIKLKKYSWFYLTRGRCYHKLGDLPSAISDFYMSHKLDLNYIYASNWLKKMYDEMGIEKVLELAQKYKDEENYEKSKMFFEIVLIYEPEYILALRGCGESCCAMKDYKNALKYFEKALGIQKSGQNYYLCGTVLFDMGRKSRAKEMFNKVIELPDDGYLKKAKSRLDDMLDDMV